MITRRFQIIPIHNGRYLAATSYELSDSPDNDARAQRVDCRWSSRVWAAAPAPIRCLDLESSGSSGEI